MEILLLTKSDQKKVAEELALKYKLSNHQLKIFYEPDEFYSYLVSAAVGKIEYVLIDTRVFQLDLFNPYFEISKCKNPVPVIIYNDPYPEPNMRATFWLQKTKEYFQEILGLEKIEAMKNQFILLQFMINSMDLESFIPGICKPQIFFTDEEKALMINIEDFKNRHKLSNSRILLFKFLYENQNRMISEKELCMHLWNSFDEGKVKTLYTYIYELRKACKNELSCIIKIFHEQKGFYKMQIFSARKNNAD